MESENYALALAFDTDAPEFARGVEVGRLWERLRLDPAPADEMVHIANAEMLLRIGDALGRLVTGEEHDKVWMTVRFGAADD